VCVPGYNDGEKLRQSLTELMLSKLNILSIGIVPVGLTRFREGLSPLRTFTKEEARNTLAIVEEIRQTYSCPFIYPADEFFVLAGNDVPDDDYYLEYPQLENGIGMLRLSLQNFRQKKRSLLKELRKNDANYLMLSSLSAQTLISKIADELNARLESQRIRVQPIRNDFFGSQISVCGLITFSDIKSQLKPQDDEIIIMPSVIFNHNGETLDGADRLTVKSTWNNPILLIDQFFEDWDYL
jgi:NifB/MoaA-like Fe-S oxidoreductase